MAAFTEFYRVFRRWNSATRNANRSSMLPSFSYRVFVWFFCFTDLESLKRTSWLRLPSFTEFFLPSFVLFPLHEPRIAKYDLLTWFTEFYRVFRRWIELCYQKCKQVLLFYRVFLTEFLFFQLHGP